MRYSATELKDGNIPDEINAKHASDDMLMLTAFLGILIGIAISVLGKYGKQLWMFVWGIGLVLCSAYLGVTIKFDVKLFGIF